MSSSTKMFIWVLLRTIWQMMPLNLCNQSKTCILLSSWYTEGPRTTETLITCPKVSSLGCDNEGSLLPYLLCCPDLSHFLTFLSQCTSLAYVAGLRPSVLFVPRRSLTVTSLALSVTADSANTRRRMEAAFCGWIIQHLKKKEYSLWSILFP